MENIFKNKKILITGHTGFKGSWLSAWLHKLDARIIGLSNNIPTNPNHYEYIKSIFEVDLRVEIESQREIQKIIAKYRPDFIFHLAAQPIVLESYKRPLETIRVNVLGTANILESLRKSNHKCIAIMITSDKSYDNVEWEYGYREHDKIGGKDPYSGSKGAAELIIKSYYESFFKNPSSNIRIGVGRAGNVIGGGDWANHRIIPDCVRSWSVLKEPEIRHPYATRPWQHVLEPLSGYIALAIKLNQNSKLNGQAFNFGPPSYQNHSVKDLVNKISKHWENVNWIDKSEKNKINSEAGLLKLNCDKALHFLGWKATLNFDQTANWTAEWYKLFYGSKDFDGSITFKQIEEYQKMFKLLK